jgi:hypothetical protein
VDLFAGLQGREVMPMTRPAKRRHHDGRRAATERWDRRQFWASVTRIVIEILEPLANHWFGGGGPGRLL